MTDIVETIRERHRSLSVRLASRIAMALDRGARDDLNAIVALLEGELLGRLRAEQRHLYPAVDGLIREHGSATATMVLDHEAIEALVGRVAAAVERLRAAGERKERTAAKQQLREALLRLDTLLQVHLSKEERVYLPLVETRLAPAERARLLEELERGTATADGGKTSTVDEGETLDVRSTPHGARHEEIFAAFARLPVGRALVLVNDHDPRPLSYQFAAEHPGTFTWEYLERGPAWRVRITRIARG